MFDISPTVALAVFVSAFALDFLYARYTYYIISMKAEMAATVFVRLAHAERFRDRPVRGEFAYILFMCLGDPGTYLTVWQRRRAAQSARHGNRRRNRATLLTPDRARHGRIGQEAFGMARHPARRLRPPRRPSGSDRPVRSAELERSWVV